MYIGGRMEGHISDHNSGIQMQVLNELQGLGNGIEKEVVMVVYTVQRRKQWGGGEWALGSSAPPALD